MRENPKTFQTSNGANGNGLYDMAGNVWQFINDWYDRDYYAYGPANNPPGPERGSLMPDGKPYRGMRGGNWYNGEHGHSRVSNRNPSYYRGPQDPDHPYYHLGFRVVLPINAESRPVIKPTPVERLTRSDAGSGRRPPREGDRPGGRKPPRGDERRGGNERAGDADQTPSDDLRPRGRQPDQRDGTSAAVSAPHPRSAFVLRSPEVAEGGTLPKDYTGDGSAATLPLEWSGAPAGTRSFALIMHHVAPDEIKWYWVLYDIPAGVTSLPKNVKRIGTLGNNSVNRDLAYAPPRDDPRKPPRKPEPRRPKEQPATGRPEDADSARLVGPDGQTVGLFKNSPQAFPGYMLFAPRHNKPLSDALHPDEDDLPGNVRATGK